jgi:hypothetical protein
MKSLEKYKMNRDLTSLLIWQKIIKALHGLSNGVLMSVFTFTLPHLFPEHAGIAAIVGFCCYVVCYLLIWHPLSKYMPVLEEKILQELEQKVRNKAILDYQLLMKQLTKPFGEGQFSAEDVYRHALEVKHQILSAIENEAWLPAIPYLERWVSRQRPVEPEERKLMAHAKRCLESLKQIREQGAFYLLRGSDRDNKDTLLRATERVTNEQERCKLLRCENVGYAEDDANQR